MRNTKPKAVVLRRELRQVMQKVNICLCRDCKNEFVQRYNGQISCCTDKRQKYAQTDICAVEDCKRKTRAAGLCASHYTKMTRQKQERVCSVDGCACRIISCGLCGKHYQQDLARRKKQTALS